MPSKVQDTQMFQLDNILQELNPVIKALESENFTILISRYIFDEAIIQSSSTAYRLSSTVQSGSNRTLGIVVETILEGKVHENSGQERH